MRSLLTNVHGRLANGPILVICYTNHALDQVRWRVVVDAAPTPAPDDSRSAPLLLRSPCSS